MRHHCVDNVGYFSHRRKSIADARSHPGTERGKVDLVAEQSQFCDQPSTFLLSGFRVQIETSVHIANSLVQDFPDQAAESVCNCPYCLLVSKAWKPATEEDLKVAAILFHCGMCHLVEQSYPSEHRIHPSKATLFVGLNAC